MKLKRATWILLTTALVLGGFVYLNEIEGSRQRAAQKEETQRVFVLSEEKIERFTIERDRQILQFERTSNPDRPWQMKRPEDIPASEPAVSFLLNLLARGKRASLRGSEQERAFTIAQKELAQYGLDKPLATVTIFLKEQVQPHKLVLGKPSFDEKYLYALIDPPVGAVPELAVALVPVDFKYAVERDLQEWKEIPK